MSSNKSYVDMFRELPPGATVIGVAGAPFLPNDCVKLDKATGFFVDAEPEEAEAVTTNYALKGGAVCVKKKW